MYVATRNSLALGDVPSNGGISSPPTDGRAALVRLPSGREGTIATLKHMRDYVRKSIRAPDQRIRMKALDILNQAQVPPRAWTREISALHRFVRDQILYVKDPVGLELVQSPEATLDIGRGDCDDKSTLLAALLEATGHPARFTVLGFNGNPFSHVMAEAKSGDGRWIPLETIIQKEMGWFPPGVTSKYSLKL